MKCNLRADLGRIGILPTPVIISSGTFGLSKPYFDLLESEYVGAVVTKTITLNPKTGNAQPRILEAPSSMINSIGLENPGVLRFIEDYKDGYGKLEIPVIVSISGNSVSEFVDIADKLNGIDGAAAIELNLSCPNVDSEGLSFGSSPERIGNVVSECGKTSKYPLIAKLSPFQAIDASFARSAEMAGASAISLINTVPAMKIDIDRFRSALGALSGGMSGPAVKPIAIKMIYEISREINLPLIGMGGISSGEDAVEFIMVGASAISIGTMNMVNPGLPKSIVEFIETFMGIHSVSGIHEITQRFTQRNS
ncbi:MULTISPECIES: dihydroorotate dehydrogenase [unclassified Mesotoga]|uniref:dihydroorotate dehydrogenase n=1 Tax=unclassified Mesotoga TaxID=1184398 RepID=UPI000DB5B737|nr:MULTISPECIES: dihydroorotate dehydrogenase [unclassified Mesotoga]PZC52122.1 hypothetical protein LH53_06815 [Mesotoga sp. TolDC]